MLRCKEILKKRIEVEFLSWENYENKDEIKKKLAEIVINTDKEIVFENKCDFKLSGCTFTFIVFYKGVFYSVNLGGAHCLYVSTKTSKNQGCGSKGNMSSAHGSEFNFGSELGSNIKSTAFATSNPTRAAIFLYEATKELMTKVHNAKIQNFDLKIIGRTEMSILTEDHSAANYDELLRIIKNGALVCKDKKKTDLPYYAQPFKIYINPAIPHSDLVEMTDWPALRYSR